MVKLIKCHFYYLFNKINLSILFVTIVIMLLFLFSNIISLDNRQSLSNKTIEYYYNSFQIMRIVVLFDALFIVGYAFLNDNDMYRMIIIDNKIKRSEYFISKVITLLLIITILYLVIFFIILLLSVIFELYMESIMLKSFIDLYVSIIYYVFLMIFVILLVNNIFMIFVIYLLTLFTYQDEFSFLVYFLPILDNNLLVLGYIYYFIIILILGLFNIIIWNNLDL